MSTLPFHRRFQGIGAVPRSLILAAGAVLFGLACGRVAISHYGKPMIEVLIGAPILVAIFRRPFVACFVLLGVTATVFSYSVMPRVNLPGHPPINAADVLLFAGVGGTLWRRPWATWPPVVRAYFYALVIFLLLALISTVRISLIDSTTARTALYGYRNLLYLGLALTVALELSGKLWRPTLDAAIALAGLVALVSLAGAASGALEGVLRNLVPNAVSAASAVAAASGAAVGSTNRIREPGLLFVYAMWLPTLVMVLGVRDGRRPLRVAALLLMLAAIGVGLNRSMYIGLPIGLLVMTVLGGARLRMRLGLVAVATALTVTLVVLTSVVPAFTAQVSRRAATVLSPTQVLASGSAQARADEFSHALSSISQRPWDGVGWEQNYGSYSGGAYRIGVENLYLDYATDFGIPATLAFLAIPGLCLAFGFRRTQSAARSFDRAMVAAVIGSVVAVLLDALVGADLQDPDSSSIFAFTLGLLLAAGLRAKRAAQTREPEPAELQPA